jgi:hypothetical protein
MISRLSRNQFGLTDMDAYEVKFFTPFGALSVTTSMGSNAYQNARYIAIAKSIITHPRPKHTFHTRMPISCGSDTGTEIVPTVSL